MGIPAESAAELKLIVGVLRLLSFNENTIQDKSPDVRRQNDEELTLDVPQNSTRKEKICSDLKGDGSFKGLSGDGSFCL